MKKRTLAFGLLQGIAVGISFNIGIFQNPSFDMQDFFLGLSVEFVGWFVAVIIFDSYYTLRLSERAKKGEKEQQEKSLVKEISQLKALTEDGTLTSEEFKKAKTKLLASSSEVEASL